ncbi:MAG: type II toxin-antitoxin system RelE/ParE family toxin [Planctomycetota bacterium]
MPRTKIVLYQDARGRVPVLEWLENLEQRDRSARVACDRQVHRLAALGHELRRPHCDFLRDGIYELRCSHRRQQYRLLYFFHGRQIAILAHGPVKKNIVPEVDIDRALIRKVAFENNPTRHSYEETTNA